MKANIPTFAPGNVTSNVVASTTSATAAMDANALVVRVYNSGSVTAFIRFGRTTATATTSDMPLPPGAVETFSKGSYDVLAAITASGTATVYVTSGEGF